MGVIFSAESLKAFPELVLNAVMLSLRIIGELILFHKNFSCTSVPWTPLRRLMGEVKPKIDRGWPIFWSSEYLVHFDLFISLWFWPVVSIALVKQIANKLPKMCLTLYD